MTVTLAVALLCAAVGVVLFAGPRMARTADALSRKTGMGGALFGVIFLALATDLPEVTLTPTAVLTGSPRLAVGGLLGAAAAQLTLIAVVDIVLREKTLLARVPRQSILGPSVVMFASLAAMLLVAGGVPTIGFVSLGSVLLVLVYIGALAAMRNVGHDDDIVADPTLTGSTDPSNVAERSIARLWWSFGGLALVLAAAGVALESSVDELGSTIGLGETAAGALLAGIVTPLPELVTAVAAARAGALSLVIGDLVGSSALDVTLLGWADVFYTDGSIFDLLGRDDFTLIGVALASTTLLILGLVRRDAVDERRVALETYLMLGVYVVGALILVI